MTELTETSPNISKLCEGRQAHLSHRTRDHGMYRFLNKILWKYYLVFALSGLGGDNDVSRVKRERWNK